MEALITNPSAMEPMLPEKSHRDLEDVAFELTTKASSMVCPPRVLPSSLDRDWYFQSPADFAQCTAEMRTLVQASGAVVPKPRCTTLRVSNIRAWWMTRVLRSHNSRHETACR